MSLARILGKSKGRQSFISDSRFVLPTSFIGLEHEYEGVKDSTLPKHTFADFWQYHEEGSLRDNGAEYVFATPMFGVDAFNALEWLVSHAKDSGWKCTKRTGIHVHLDVRDLTVPQLAGLCIIYAAVEPILYHWVGDGRDGSHFCIPLYRADEALLGTASIIRSAFNDDKEDGHTALGLSEGYQRYAGFNLQALSKFGSIEFRQLQTTHDLVRIQDWINMIMSLKATALKLPQSDGAVVRMIQRMGAAELLHYVFPPILAAKLYTPKSQEELIVRGLPSARDIAVHGCNTESWVKQSFPRGEHKGFSTWLKKTKETKNKAVLDFELQYQAILAEGNHLLEDEGPWEDEAAPPQPGLEFILPAQAPEQIQQVVGGIQGVEVPFNNIPGAYVPRAWRVIPEIIPQPAPQPEPPQVALRGLNADALLNAVRQRPRR